MQRRFIQQLIWCVTLGVLIGTGCSTSPTRAPLTPEEKKKLELAITNDLHLSLERQLKFKRDDQVQQFLANLAGRLGEKSARVILIGDVHKRWRSFGLREGRVYFSAPLLKQLQFENEVAAVIALELCIARAGYQFKRLAELRPPAEWESSLNWDLSEGELMGPGGVFTYEEVDLARSTKEAVELLYQAGYDPRGVSAIWRFYTENADKSPFEKATAQRLEEKSRHAIAQFAPLRNPVVRSQAFLMIQRRIQQL